MPVANTSIGRDNESSIQTKNQELNRRVKTANRNYNADEFDLETEVALLQQAYDRRGVNVTVQQTR